MPDGKLNDEQLVDEIEKIVDQFTQYMFDANSPDKDKSTMATFYMGKIWGTLMKRDK